ncbi:desulfoferrodoxin [Gemmatimonadota bacterium]
MSKRGEVYKCAAGEMMVEVLHGGEGDLIHHGKPMEQLSENTTDAAQEKHVPVIEKTAGGYKVKVGSVAHPMADEHFIQWIELNAGNKTYRQYLEPGEAPEAEFKIDADQVSAREYCNLHGLWKA